MRMVSEPNFADAIFLKGKPKSPVGPAAMLQAHEGRPFMLPSENVSLRFPHFKDDRVDRSNDLISSYISQYEDHLMPIVYNVHQDGQRKGLPSKEQLITSIGDYQFVRTLGKGSTAKVKLAKHRLTGELVAIKIVSRRKFQAAVASTKRPSHETLRHKENRILREALIMHVMDHPNIVKLLDLMVTDDWFILIFEYVEGVQLLDFIISHNQLRESLARKLFRQLLAAVYYCHLHAIVHRDLKIENIIITNERGICKLLDFGLSNFYENDKTLTTYCGSLYFAAPELLHGRPYTGPEIDVWSLGVILYVMVTGKVPFDDPNVSKLHERIKSGQFDIPRTISAPLQKLLQRMLCLDPAERITMPQLAADPWVTDDGVLESPFHGILSANIPPIDILDTEAMNYLRKHLCFQFMPEYVETIMRAARDDWAQYVSHPIVALYRLYMEKKCKRLFERTPLDLSFESISLATERPSSAHLELNFSALRPLMANRPRAASAPSEEAFTDSRSRQKRRALSIGATILEDPMQASPIPETDLLPLKSVFVSGLFSAHVTSAKSPQDLKRRVTSALSDLNIDYEDHLSFLHCYHRSSLAVEQPEVVGVEISFVKVVLLGAYGVHFKRLSGQYKPYKRLCNLLLSKIK
jgi:serine/threonine protein kinase